MWAVFQGIASLPAAALTIKDVRLGVTSSRETRLVIELDQSTKFQAFVLDAPYRVVVDLPKAGWKAPSSAMRKNNPLITGYRSGALADGSVRIVLDVQAPLDMSEPFLLPPSDGVTGWRLVFDFRRSTPDKFLALKGRLFEGQAPPVSNSAAAAPSSVTAAAVVPSVVAAARLAAPLPEKKPVSGFKKRTIILDAGHGGGDPGAVGEEKIIEKNITLAVARELKAQLEGTGRYKVVLTRTRDAYIPLRRRVAIAREEGGDLFISLHADKIGRKGVQGASVYTLSEEASDEETAMLAEDANNSGIIAGVDLASQTEEVADILVDLAMRDKMNQSNYFAEVLIKTFKNDAIRMVHNGHRSAGFAVLKAPDIPSVLVELGFLSNPREARLLNSPAFQRKMAAAILSGVEQYFRKMDVLQKT